MASSLNFSWPCRNCHQCSVTSMQSLPSIGSPKSWDVNKTLRKKKYSEKSKKTQTKTPHLNVEDVMFGRNFAKFIISGILKYVLLRMYKKGREMSRQEAVFERYYFISDKDKDLKVRRKSLLFWEGSLMVSVREVSKSRLTSFEDTKFWGITAV